MTSKDLKSQSLGEGSRSYSDPKKTKSDFLLYLNISLFYFSFFQIYFNCCCDLLRTIIFQFSVQKMYSLQQGKSKNKLESQSIKKQRPKPEWTTDFINREQYKLSEVEKIQKKAALQSKHRQEAKRLLEERRKKLEMGIIDDQTRKIYETALTSKNICINPPAKKNLTEMIRYQKQQKQKNQVDQEDCSGSQRQEDFDEIQQPQRQLKEAQNFIKRFEKAKKQQKIERAVQILSNDKSLSKEKKNSFTKQPSLKINSILNASDQQIKKSKISICNIENSKNLQGSNQADALSSIEDTIKFMEQKLFAAKKTVEEHSKSFTSDTSKDYFQNQKIETFQFQQKETHMPEKRIFKKIKQEVKLDLKDQDKQFQDEQENFRKQMTEISLLKIKYRDQQNSSSDDQCLETIRKMGQLMDNQGNQFDDYESNKLAASLKGNVSPLLGFNQPCSKKAQKSCFESEDSVSFSLTANNEDENSRQNSFLNFEGLSNGNLNLKINHQVMINGKSGNDQFILTKQQDFQDQYLKIKQNLFSCLSPNSVENSNQKFQTQQYLKNFHERSKFNKKEEVSENSLMIGEKINKWKKQLINQADSEEQEIQDTNFKTTTLNKKLQGFASTTIQKQQQQSQQQQDSQYIYNHSSQKNQNTNSMNSCKLQPLKQINQSNPIKIPSKKPPLKKTQSTDKFQEMKKIISNANTQIQKIQIQPLKIEPVDRAGQVLGFDFRGSVNIKKNVLSK